MRRNIGARRPIDARSVAEAFQFPGIDPRQWVSYGLVDGGDSDPVSFDEEDGQPYVYVTLEPSKVACTCRVGMDIAGNGEGEWTPFVKGDEVVVVLPEGREDNGVIIRRLCNRLDKFPMESVAGQDPKKNAFGFRRRRTPFVEEYAGPIMFRSALTGALFSIDSAGTITLKDSENAALQMGADSFSYMGPSSSTKPPEFILQFALTQGQFIVQVKDAMFQLSASTAKDEVNTITVPGSMSIATVGNAAAEHVVTVEALWNALYLLALQVPALVGAGPAAVDGIVAGIVAQAATSTGWTAATATKGAVVAGFVAQPPKPAPDPIVGLQTLPGLGCPGLFVG